MKILVTGGTGFIGSHLIKRLINLKHDVFCIDINYPVGNNRYLSDEYTLIKGDICDRLFLSEINDERFDIIFHFASNANVPLSVKEPYFDFTVNAIGTINMLEYARQTGVKKFIFASSVSIFDTCNKLPLDENSKIKVTSPYGASKLTGESYCYAYYRSYGLNTNVVRFFNVYGEGVRKLFIYDMVKKVFNAETEVVIMGDGNQVRDYLFIDDLIDGIILVSEKGIDGEDYNIASGKKIAIIDIIKKITIYMNKPYLQIKPTNTSYPGDIKEWYADISKMQKLGFNPKFDFDEALKRTIKDIVANIV